MQARVTEQLSELRAQVARTEEAFAAARQYRGAQHDGSQHRRVVDVLSELCAVKKNETTHLLEALKGGVLKLLGRVPAASNLHDELLAFIRSGSDTIFQLGAAEKDASTQLQSVERCLQDGRCARVVCIDPSAPGLPRHPP